MVSMILEKDFVHPAENVEVLKYRRQSKTNVPFCHCSKCGKSLVKEMYVVQGINGNKIHISLCDDCVKQYN